MVVLPGEKVARISKALVVFHIILNGVNGMFFLMAPFLTGMFLLQIVSMKSLYLPQAQTPSNKAEKSTEDRFYSIKKCPQKDLRVKLQFLVPKTFTSIHVPVMTLFDPGQSWTKTLKSEDCLTGCHLCWDQF